jgi:uroporphyrinogen decarboxylase
VSLLVDALERRPVPRVPVWMMRQAGRYLPEYRAIREKHDFLAMAKTPDLAAEVTLQPVRILDVDAAILFSDILIPVEAMGVKLAFTPAPRFERPVRTRADVEALRIPDPVEATGFVMETLRLVRRELPPAAALLGFGGAPWTLASYLVEGETSRDFPRVKAMMFAEPVLFQDLLRRITDTMILYLNAQIDAGAEAIQIFDSWAGALAPEDYETAALPETRRLIEGLRKKSVPVILYANGSGPLLDLMARSGADALSIDWRTDLAAARGRLGGSVAIQGNLDPAVLLGPAPLVEARVAAVLERAGRAPGYVFNLGHGMLPTVPVANARLVVETVRRLGRRNGG